MIRADARRVVTGVANQSPVGDVTNERLKGRAMSFLSLAVDFDYAVAVLVLLAVPVPATACLTG